MNNLFIELNVDKEPYIKKLTDDNVINLTGESGSGKSYYTNHYLNNDNYVVIDTDEVFARFEDSKGINKELGIEFRNKYKELPNLFNDFDIIYQDILEFFKDTNKIIVIDSAQFRNVKDINILKGTVIVMRTSVDKCYNRCIERYKINHPNATEEDIINYSNKKRGMYIWHKSINDFILKIDNK